MLRDAREHLGTDLISLVKREYEVGPTVACENLVGAFLTRDAPTQTKQGGKYGASS
jgi:hypothetical protein